MLSTVVSVFVQTAAVDGIPIYGLDVVGPQATRYTAKLWPGPIVPLFFVWVPMGI